MSDFPDIGHDEAAAYRGLLRECERLYRSCATQFAEQCPNRLQDSADAFIGRMLELHRGLVVKVFIEIARADHRVSQRERKLALELFDHCWGKRLSEDQLIESLDHYAENAQPRWDGLLFPEDAGGTQEVQPAADAHQPARRLHRQTGDGQDDGRPPSGTHSRRPGHPGAGPPGRDRSFRPCRRVRLCTPRTL